MKIIIFLSKIINVKKNVGKDLEFLNNYNVRMEILEIMTAVTQIVKLKSTLNVKELVSLLQTSAGIIGH
jgi:hypothetical protein